MYHLKIRKNFCVVFYFFVFFWGVLSLFQENKIWELDAYYVTMCKYLFDRLFPAV